MPSSLVRALALSPLPKDAGGLEAFAADSLWTPCNARGVFGGQVVGQAMGAASATVRGMQVHSQHCYFLLPATSDARMIYTVERLRDAAPTANQKSKTSLTPRLVKASQAGRAVFVLVASFAAPAELPAYPSALPSPPPAPDQASRSSSANPAGPATSSRGSAGTRRATFRPRFDLRMPAVAAWDACALEESVWARNLAAMGGAVSPRARNVVENYIKLGRQRPGAQLNTQEREDSAIAIAMAPLKRPAAHRRAVWMQLRLAPGEAVEGDMVQAMFAYITDFQFVGTAARALGLTWTSSPRIGMLASLDHTTHFPPLPAGFDPAAPLLHVMEAVSASAAAGRGTVRGLLFTQRGELVCASLQEGVVRPSAGRRAADGADRMEGALGGVDVARDEGAARAKL